jgi:hypothetical protein
MPGWYQIRFADGSPDVEWSGARGFYYEFADGASIRLRPTIAWCCNCSDFVDAEWIPSLAELRSELVELNDPKSSRTSWFTFAVPPFDKPPFIERSAQLHAKAKDEAAKRIEWRALRQSAPRCLICGTTDIRFPNDDQSVDIPGRGTALVECVGMCSTEFCNWFYTPEGIRIARDTKPTYWQIPSDEGLPE